MSFEHLYEFQKGIIGKNVWKYILTKAEIPKKDVNNLLEKIPPTEKLQAIPRNNDEIVAYVPSRVNGSFLNPSFWEKNFGLKFHHNASICNFSWDEYSSQKMGGDGLYIVKSEGIGLGKPFVEQIKELPKGYVITTTGIQLAINAAYILMGIPVNEKLVIRCVCNVFGVSAVGGNRDARAIYIFKDAPALANKRAALGCCKKIL